MSKLFFFSFWMAWFGFYFTVNQFTMVYFSMSSCITLFFFPVHPVVSSSIKRHDLQVMFRLQTLNVSWYLLKVHVGKYGGGGHGDSVIPVTLSYISREIYFDIILIKRLSSFSPFQESFIDHSIHPNHLKLLPIFSYHNTHKSSLLLVISTRIPVPPVFIFWSSLCIMAHIFLPRAHSLSVDTGNKQLYYVFQCHSL